MYQITCDEYILHDARIPELKVINAKCSLALNKTGSLTFYVAPTHPYYNKINKHTSEITLYQDNKMLFRGRVLNDDIDFDNIKCIECEGELSYFLDSIQRGKEYHLDGGSDNVIETYLKNLVSIHNSQVDDRKKFTVGVVNVTDPNNYLYNISNYEDTLTTINDKLINTYGGYIQVRHDGDTRYIDYLSTITNTSNQIIEFGKNIIDMNKHISGEDVYTALIPLGATIEDETSTSETYEKRLKISKLDNSTDGTIIKKDDYIYDSEAVSKWGWIWRVEKWNDVTVASNLLSKAKKKLKSAVNSTLTIEMTAIDLHLINVDIDGINVGDKIRCISKPHDLDTVLIVNSIDIDIDNPANTMIKLTTIDGKPIIEKSITSDNKDNKKDITDVKDSLNEDYTSRKDFDSGIEELKDWTNTKFGDNDTAIKDWTNNQISDNNNAMFNNDNSIIKDWTNGQISDNTNNLKDWVSDNFYPASGGEVDLSEYAKIADVNTAFNELATALGGL